MKRASSANRLPQRLLLGSLLLAAPVVADSAQSVAGSPSPAPGAALQAPGPRSLADPVPEELSQARALLAGAKRVTLDEAITSTLQRHPSLQGAFAAIQESEWRLIANQRRWFPTAGVEASPGTTLLGRVFSTTVANYPNSTSNSFATSTYNNSYSNFSNFGQGSIGLVLSWSFFDPSRQPAIQGADAGLRAQKLTFNVVARSLVLDSQTSFYNLQERQQLIQIYEEIYQQNLRQLQRVQAQFRVGMTHIGDVEQKQTQLLNQLTDLVLLYRQQAQSASNLATTMGLAPGSAVLPAGEPGDPPVWTLSQEATLNEALRLREEIQASLAESEAARWEARRLVNTYLPVLMLAGTAYASAGQGVFSATVGQDPSPYFSRQSSSEATVGLGLRWDFLDGGIRSAQARQAEAQARILTSQAEQNRLSVGDQIRRSYASYQTALLGLPGAEQAYAAARSAEHAAVRRYDVGIGTMTDLIQSTQMLAQAAQNLSTLRLMRSNAIAELYRYTAQWPTAHRRPIREALERVGGAGR